MNWIDELFDDIDKSKLIDAIEQQFITDLLEAAAIDEEKKVYLRAEVRCGIGRERAEELKKELYEALPPLSNSSLTALTKHIKKICNLK